MGKLLTSMIVAAISLSAKIATANQLIYKLYSSLLPDACYVRLVQEFLIHQGCCRVPYCICFCLESYSSSTILHFLCSHTCPRNFSIRPSLTLSLRHDFVPIQRANNGTSWNVSSYIGWRAWNYSSSVFFLNSASF